jgi:hypothetical protein
MGTSQFGRGHKPCTGTESQSTEWQNGSLPERTQRKGNTTAALECRSGNGGEHMSRELPRGLSIFPDGSLVLSPPLTVPGMQLAHKLKIISVSQFWCLSVLRFISSDAVLSISVECDYIDQGLDD